MIGTRGQHNNHGLIVAKPPGTILRLVNHSKNVRRSTHFGSGHRHSPDAASGDSQYWQVLATFSRGMPVPKRSEAVERQERLNAISDFLKATAGRENVWVMNPSGCETLPSLGGAGGSGGETPQRHSFEGRFKRSREAEHREGNDLLEQRQGGVAIGGETVALLKGAHRRANSGRRSCRRVAIAARQATRIPSARPGVGRPKVPRP